MMATAEDTVLTLQPVKYKLAGITVNFYGVAGVDTVKQTIKAPIIEPSSTAASTPR